MSNSPQGGSPSLLNNLRQYRFQKKPSIMGNGTETTQTNGSNNHSSSMASSSSTNKPNEEQPQVYKRIRLMDSGSESDSSPIKQVPSSPLPPVDKLTQERRMSNMLGMFPDVNTLVVKNVLLKHNWNEERTRDELLKFDPEQAEINKSVKPKFQNEFLNMIRNGSHTTMSKVYSSLPHTRTILAQPAPPAKKMKIARKKNDDSDSDNEYHSRKNDKVFDSDDDSDTEVTNDMTGDKKKVYEFLSTAKDTELQMLQGCSLKKAEVIMSLRPFKGWVDLVQKFQDSKHLNTDILNSTQDLLMTRNNIQKLMKKCTMLAKQLEAAVANGSGMLKQPAILEPSLKLAPYQMVGLNWLCVLNSQKVNGILADEMGLGKTVQVIAFLAHLKETKKAEKTHLIVVPSSTLDNWHMEFARWCPSMNVVMYYGNQEERKSMRIQWAREGLGDVDVILTTYNLVSSSPEEKKMFRVTPMHYIVFDEAHMLKNMSTQRYENLIKIKAARRILLTGTPLQNNLLELMSLLCFVMPHLFANNTDDLKSLFQKNAKAACKKSSEKTEDDVPLFEQTQINQAKRIMKPFLLRRLKRDVLKDLPTKTDHTVPCPMAPSQQKQYKELIKSFSASDGTIHATTEQNGMSMMMDMRKLANHPLLLRYFYDDSKLKRIANYLAADSFYKENNPDHVYHDLLFMSDFQIHQLTYEYKSIVNMKVPDDLIVKSGKFLKLDEMLPKLKSEGHRVLIFSQFTMMLDVLEPYLKIRGHNYLRLDGSTAVTLRQDLIDQYNEESDIFVFLLSTRAGGLGINLTAADTVIIHDIDFNPYNDKQAEDRCHRMGQTRPVTIYRFLSGGTIEEGIYQVAQEKLSLERDVTNTNENEPTELKNVVRLLNSALGVTSPSK